MKKEGILVIAIAVLIIVIISLLPLIKITPEKKVSNFKECVESGNPVKESFPRQCDYKGKTYVEEVENKIYCNDSQRNAEACIQIYDPVCGFVNVECVTEPCNPVPETFSNECVACTNQRVDYYIKGECPSN